MPAPTLLDRYFSAFNRHDPEAVSALFGAKGIYVDLAVSAGVSGEALKEYLRSHYAAFPDARYRILRKILRREGPIAVEWRFQGTNTGPLGGRPASNRAVEVHGASFLEARAGKIRWLHGYYDRRGLLRQLGL
jgi:steroid delta-isomerase-like uncharacterized protein